MKNIDVQDQPVLSFARTVRITSNGIRYRLFRALVTVVVVTVAIAFLMNVFSESLVKRSVRRHTQSTIYEMRLAAVWASRLMMPDALDEILRQIASMDSGAPFYRECQAFAGISDPEMSDYQESVVKGVAYLDFFSDLDYARRRQLIGNAQGVGVFDNLDTGIKVDRLLATVRSMRTVRFISEPEEFREFVRDWQDVRRATVRIRDGQRKAVAEIHGVLGEEPVMSALARADGEFGDAIRQAGFVLEPEEAGKVAQLARDVLDRTALERSLDAEGVRQAVAARLDRLPKEVTANVFWGMLEDRQDVEWFLERTRKADAPAGSLSAERVLELAATVDLERSLNRAERMGADISGGIMGLGERMTWLLFVSMLVCVVGISNAMLMSVTERFREIATLKCLGALDGFIMLMFVLEACFLGIMGGIAGAILGTFLGVGRMILSFGGLLFSAIPIGDLIAANAISLVLGVILAAVASVYPSLKAARLAPMEAMRIE